MKLPALLFLAAGAFVQAQAPPSNDPVGPTLFPIELIRAHAETIAIGPEQGERMRAVVEGAKEQFAGLGERWKQAGEALARAIEEKGADEAAVMAAFDKVQDAEREVKRAQLKVLVELRNILSEEQRAWLTQIKAEQAQQVRERGERVKAALEKLRDAGALLEEVRRVIEPAGK